MIMVREAEKQDAEKLVHLIQAVDETSEYMLWEVGERKLTVENQVKMIANLREMENSTLLVAEDTAELMGYLFAIGGKARRNKHVAYIVVGVAEKYRGTGIGMKLFRSLDEWATQHTIYRLELTVVTKNKAGLHLYKKAGFEIEGIKRDSLYIDGKFMDEYFMSKLV